ncbi:MAG: bifunctional glutamate N-acetyltransferase/amino-acid acetyltransferase ArgJ [Candidatus Omnitrophica bacterium]|nr:bifunctional glutamate N-acetyltransferase/amino-acid acetyltransferase ArgJ [Candidatus Omnitrophota bacterium]
MEWIKGGVTAPKGFLCSGLRSGIKRWARDLGLLYSEVPAAAAALFTKSRLKGAPLLVTQEHLRGGRLQAVVVNSGNANCCTGPRGLLDARRMTRLTALALRIPERRVAVCSTGAIGVYLPMGRIERKIQLLVPDLSRQKNLEFAEAIMTTDKKIKEAAVAFKMGRSQGILGAVCKGSGMIYPRLATMLCFITTDVAVERKLLQSLLGRVGEATFNRITVDGDTSPNDTVLLFANGVAGNPRIASAATKSFRQFEKALHHVMEKLSKKIVADGEGATQVAEITVTHAKSDEEALQACRFVANSSLVKTALFGRDPNWGRIAASVGASGVSFLPEKLSVALGEVWLFRKGTPVVSGNHRFKRFFQQHPLKIRIDLGAGRGHASMWTCDLTEEYVRINAHYRT